MEVNGVFEGGGVRGIALAGAAVATLDDDGVIVELQFSESDDLIDTVTGSTFHVS